jgi:O-antigen biosynthesis protein
MNSLSKQTKQQCVLVLGMHRSGTSALTRCLNLLGMDLGSHLLSPEKANAKGFWEHADAVRINDALLQSFGMYWHSLDPLPENWLQSEGAAAARKEIRALIKRDFESLPLWGLKDPRMCRLAPLWLDVLKDMGIEASAVFVIRSPLEVAASLARAHGLSTSACVVSWMQHLAESEIATRGMTRTMIDYDRLLASPGDVLSVIGHALNIVWPIAVKDRREAIDSFLDVGLRTHRQRIVDDSEPSLVRHMVDTCERIIADDGSDHWSELSSLSNEATELMRVLAYLGKPSGASQDDSAVDAAAHGQMDEVHAELYYACENEHFSEQRSIKCNVPTGRSQLEFKLPDIDFSSSRFRFDPVDREGCCVLHSLILLDGTGKVIWDWSKSTGLVGLIGARRIRSFANPQRDLYFLGDDPQIPIELPPGVSLSGLALRFDVERLSDSELCHEFEAASQWGGEQSKLLADTQRKLDEAFSQGRELSVALQSSHDEVQRLKVAHAAIQAELDATRASTIWRALVKIRGALQLLPIGMRKALRRTIKAVWWVLTPWQMSARLRFRHAQRGGLQAKPAQHLSCERMLLDSKEAVWKTEGGDPFFYLSQGAGQAVDLPGGWYFLDIPAIELSGSLKAPRLYLDYEAGFSEVFSIALNNMRSTEGFRGLVRFDYRVCKLRFDPTTEACEFVLGNVSLRRVSKFWAARYMYRSLIERGWNSANLIKQAFNRYRLGGLRKAGDWLYGEFAPASDAKAGPRNYGDWLKQHDAISMHEWKAMRRASKSLALKPLISIVMPTFNTPEALLRRCIQSVRKQAYPYWELCIADDASPDDRVREVLRECEALDRRIKVVLRDTNGHISEASNSALALASGEWIALLDHDDELPVHALYLVAKAINERPDAGLIYSDEDKIDESGHRFDPYFKPDWNQDLFYSQNMICHLGVYKADLVQKVGGFRAGYEGSQDYDLALRCIEHLRPDQILHIPRVLYHWRAVPGSTALKTSEKSYAAVAGEHALTDHFSRIGTQGVDVQILVNGYRVKRPVGSLAQPKVSLIIPTRDRVGLLRMCVESILQKTEYANYEIVVVDNQSVERETLDYFDQLRKDSRVRIFKYDAPFNYSAINNAAVAATNCDVVGLINNDIEVIGGDWLSEMVSQAMRPEIGAVGAKLYYPDDTIQHAGVVLGIGGVAGHAYAGMPRHFIGDKSRAVLVQNLSAVTAACLLIRRSTFDAVGGLDPRLQVAFNDVDFCLRVRESGLRNIWTPYAELYHHESASRGYEDTPEKQDRFMREIVFMTERWGSLLLNDPAYNPNLTLDTVHYDLASSPRVAPLIDVVSGCSPLLPASHQQ